MDEDPNDRGWALLGKPDRTRDDLEEAVRCFGLAVAGGNLPAVANLGNGLVALDRTDEAIAQLTKLAERDDEIAGRAHNWLGWHSQQIDLTRAITHLERATELAPLWGVAWLNLAKAYDATGDLQRAAVAYGTAIRCNDSHDDTYARDRRLQLEMQLLLRGEPPPPAPPTAIADSRAFEIVRETAAALATPHAFMIRPTQRAAGRVMPAIIGTVVEGRAIGACIVQPTSLVLAREGDVLAFAESANLMAWLSALDPAAVSPIDAAMWIFDKLRQPDWSWAISSLKPAAITLWPLRIEIRARAGGGVTVRVGRASFEITTVPAGLELAPALRDEIAAEQARLHWWDLCHRGRYRVLEPFGTLSHGELATLTDIASYGREDLCVYVFEGDRGGRASLDERTDNDKLANIDRHLARHV
ncbi:MAG TPA: tetratricopeptide repeat protein [Kofleriaceae bacterium]|nr:tetratricopeptide repeat protein [Kofleriaceae bacterium]